ncbi:MAG TPA: SDR family NAD(P)-dependent oxidoreductase [Polyangiaceae bacterium]
MATNRAIVVTGANGGLGRALVRALSDGDARVIAIGRGVEQAALDKELGARRAIAAAFDVVSRPAWAELIARLAGEGLEPYGAVLSAGAWRGGKKLHEESDDGTWTAMLGANLETARVSLQALLPGMVERKRGSVVLIGSRVAERPWESAKAAAYAASKAGLVALAEAVAAEVLESSVRVNVILPSTIDTPQNRAGMPNADASRWISPESLADVAKFLLSDAARDISGAAIPVYGRA